jgi:hypothetical protein
MRKKPEGIQPIESVPVTTEEHEAFRLRCEQESLIRKIPVSMRAKAAELIREYLLKK